jgi:hypothetical protein
MLITPLAERGNRGYRIAPAKRTLIMPTIGLTQAADLVLR